MGTRNLTCVVKNGEFKVAQYGQWDGYPSGAGVAILAFLRDMDRAAFEQGVDQASWITDKEVEERWKDFGVDIEGSSGLVAYDVANKFGARYPEISRDTGCDILELLAKSKEPLKLRDAHTFAADGLFCEWAYVVDLDNDTLEVYSGFAKADEEGLDHGRFSKLEKPEDQMSPRREVITLQKTYPLGELPSDEEFLKELEETDCVTFFKANEDEE